MFRLNKLQCASDKTALLERLGRLSQVFHAPLYASIKNLPKINMKLSKLLLAASIATLTSIASAESFTFSYQIYEGSSKPLHTVTGSFDGIRGLGVNYLVTGLSNVSVFVDGTSHPFTGNGQLHLGHYNPNNTNQILDGDAVVSKLGDKNNFVFSDSGMANNTGWSNTFFSNGITPNGQTGYLFQNLKLTPCC